MLSLPAGDGLGSGLGHGRLVGFIGTKLSMFAPHTVVAGASVVTFNLALSAWPTSSACNDGVIIVSRAYRDARRTWPEGNKNKGKGRKGGKKKIKDVGVGRYLCLSSAGRERVSRLEGWHEEKRKADAEGVKEQKEKRKKKRV